MRAYGMYHGMMGRWSWLAGLFLLLFDGSCYKRNPAVCCSTPPECEEIGFDDITPCDGLLVCLDGACVAPQCTSSTECSAPTPYCVNQVCTATCSADPDCTGVAGLPFCAPDGACVACLDETACTDPSSPICDDSTHSCRSCAEDGECPSGICLATEGTCAPEDDVVFVATGGTDAGDCTSANPCHTIDYGLTKVTATRRVLRLVDADFLIPDGTVIDRSVYVDTASTRVTRSSSGPILTIDGAATVIVEGIRVDAPGSVPVVSVVGQASLTLADVDLDAIVFGTSVVAVNNASLRITGSHVAGVSAGTGVDCSAVANLEVVDSRFDSATHAIAGDLCVANIHHSRFDRTSPVALSRSQLRMENNLISTLGSGTAEVALSVNQARLGTAIRFNTFVSSNAGTGAAINCSGLAQAGVVSSNIFAWQSPSPVTAATTCGISNCLYDGTATTTPGTSNTTGAAFSTIFVDAVTGDFHPSASSPAREAAESGLDVSDDLDHSPRPDPAGSAPDIGAYEVP